MSWSLIRNIMRVWSFRPWLYNWDVVFFPKKQEQAMERCWQRWFKELALIKSQTTSNVVGEIDDTDMYIVNRVYHTFTLVVRKENTLTAKDLEDIAMLVKESSTIRNWRLALITKGRKIEALSDWIILLPTTDEIDIFLLIFVCYNFYLLQKAIHFYDGGLEMLYNCIMSETEAIQRQREEGNKEFKVGHYDKAIQLYTDAIFRMPYNMKLYSNRSQAQLKMNHPRAAACDGLRCLHISPTWEKGWIRFSSGLLGMGRVVEAWKVLQLGVLVIPHCSEIFTTHLNALAKRPVVAQYMQNMGTDSSMPIMDNVLVGRDVVDVEAIMSRIRYTMDVVSDGMADCNLDDMPELVADERSAAATAQTEPAASKRPPKPKKGPAGKKGGSRKGAEGGGLTNGVGERAVGDGCSNGKNVVNPAVAEMERGSQLFELLGKASSAWLGNRMRNAVTSYSEALRLLTSTAQQEIGYHNDHVAVVMYALGMSHIGIGNEKALQEGIEQFTRITKRFPGLVFPMAYLGIGMAYIKWNRFKMAVEPLSKGVRVVRNGPQLSVYCWPGLTAHIAESQPDTLLERLESLLLECRAAPVPLAICRLSDCDRYQTKTEIYSSDPNFKGYVELCCFARCRVTYHTDCWKRCKSASNKEILSGKCFTPNCGSPLSHLTLYDHTGEVVSKKENTLASKERPLPKEITKMKPSSQNTIMKRLDRKVRRKQKREELQQRSTEATQVDEQLREDEGAAGRTGREETRAALPVDMLTCTRILPRRDDSEHREDDTKKFRKRRRGQKEARGVVQMDLAAGDAGLSADTDGGGSVPHAAPSSVCSSSYSALDVFEEMQQEEFPSLNPVATDIVEQHVLAAEAVGVLLPPRVPTAPMRSRSASPAISEVVDRDTEIATQYRQAIRESLFQLFREVLHTHGPLHVEDERITAYVASFPPETLQIIASEGGIGGLLRKSINFTLIDDTVGLIKDSNKIRKVVNKRKAQLRRSAATSKKGSVPDAIPSRLRSTAGAGPSLALVAAASVAKCSAEPDSDVDSTLSSDTVCSESTGGVSNSPRNLMSPWKRQPSVGVNSDVLSNLEAIADPESAPPPDHATLLPPGDLETVAVAYRLGANRLRAAMALGRLASDVGMPVGVEIRLRDGWQRATDLMDVGIVSGDEARKLLWDSLDVVFSSCRGVRCSPDMTVYFFGLGQSSVESADTRWFPGPELGFGDYIIIALAIDGFPITKITVDLSELDSDSLETLVALNDAAITLSSATDHAMDNLTMQKVVLHIFSVMGRRVASGDEETSSLLSQSATPTLKPFGLLSALAALPEKTRHHSSSDSPELPASPGPTVTTATASATEASIWNAELGASMVAPPPTLAGCSDYGTQAAFGTAIDSPSATDTLTTELLQRTDERRDSLNPCHDEVTAHQELSHARHLQLVSERHLERVIWEHDCVVADLQLKYQDEKKRAETAEMATLQLTLELALMVIDRASKEAELQIGKIQAGAKQYTDQLMTVPVVYKTTEALWKTALHRISYTREITKTTFEEQRRQKQMGVHLDALPCLPQPPSAPDIPKLPPAPLVTRPLSQRHTVAGGGDATFGSRVNRAYLDHGSAAVGAALSVSVPASPPPWSASSVASAERPPSPLVKKTVAAVVSTGTVKPRSFPFSTASIGNTTTAAINQAPRNKNSFDRIVDVIQRKFPNFDRPRISSFLQQLRVSRGGSLSGMKTDDVLRSMELYVQRNYEVRPYPEAPPWCQAGTLLGAVSAMCALCKLVNKLLSYLCWVSCRDEW